jgi:plastocyanin
MDKKKLILTGLGAILLISIVGVALAVADLSSTEAPVSETQQEEITVVITDNGFEPESLLVSPGTKVVWKNEGEQIHAVAAGPHPTHQNNQGLESPEIPKGGTYSYTFTQAGTVDYHDHLNPVLNGTVIVKD